MKVVITAGGKGTRIRCMTDEIPKGMIPINGIPILEYQINLAYRYGYRDFLFLTGYLGNQIEDYFKDGSQWGVRIEYYRESVPLGTAGAFATLKEKIKDDFWVFYGDTVMDFDMEKMLHFHKTHHADATLFLHPNDHPFDSDLVEISDDLRIIAFYPVSRKEGYYRNLVNAAVYIFSPFMFNFIEANKKSDFGKNIFPLALDKGASIFGYVSTEYVKDMGTPDRFFAVSNDVSSGKVARLNCRNKRPAIFLDRDGVINKEVNLLASSEKMELIPGVSEAIRMINNSEYLAIVITNQPVIARNLCDFSELKNIHNKMETLLGEKCAFLDAIYFCPHHPDKGYPEERVEYKISCECRKPKPGMILKAAKEWNIDLSQSYFIGDTITDIQTGEAANLKHSILITPNKENELLSVIKTILS